MFGQFRAIIGFCLIILLFCSPKVHSQDSSANILFSEALFGNASAAGAACYRIPSIVTAPNGDLIAAIDERVPSCRDLKWSRDINIVARRSSDNGDTWTEIERVADFPDGQSASDPSMIVDVITGDIYLFYNYMDLDKEPEVYYLHVIKSTDNGKTWSSPVDITSQIAKPEWHNDFKFITSGRGIQTRSGKLLHTMVNLDSGLHVFGSDDHGATWKLYDTPVVPGNESKIVELSDGSWMINSRLNGSGYRQVHVSDNEGLTWESRRQPELVDPGCNASIVSYPLQGENGKQVLLFSNANSAEARQNMTIRISTDDGITWSEGKSVYEGSSAYSSMTVLANGDIGLFYEKDDYTTNVFVRIGFEGLTER